MTYNLLFIFNIFSKTNLFVMPKSVHSISIFYLIFSQRQTLTEYIISNGATIPLFNNKLGCVFS